MKTFFRHLLLLALLATSLSAATTVNITAPAGGAIIPVGSSLYLKATATSNTGFIAKVEFLVNGTVVGTVNTAPYNLAYTFATQGTFPVVARAYDNTGATQDSAAANVTIVAAIGTGPTISIISPTTSDTIASNQRVLITASAFDNDGFIPGGTGVTFLLDGDVLAPVASGQQLSTGEANPDLSPPYVLTWNPTVAKSYDLRAQTTDDKGNIRLSPQLLVTVSSPVPTVSIVTPVTGSSVALGNAVTVLANASGASGQTSSITKVDFFEDGILIASDTTSPYSITWTPAFSRSTPYSLSARVTDVNGSTASSAPVQITVLANTPPTVSITTPANNTSTTSVNTAFTLAATASDPDVGGAIANVVFYANGSSIGAGTLANTGDYRLSWTPTTAGSFVITAVATDNANGSTTSASRTITVATVGGLPPTVTLALAGGGASVPSGSSRVLNATAADTDGFIERVDFYLDGVLIGSDTSFPYNFLFTASQTAGVHQFVARAFDNSGLSSDSQPSTIQISNAIGSAPVVTTGAPVTGAFLPTGVATVISGSASDSDGAISGVQVFVNGVSLGAATVSGSTWTINWTPSTLGNIQIVAIATDDKGNAAAAPTVGVNITDNTSPAITLTLTPGAAPGTTMPVGATRNVVANVTPAVGRAIVRVEFFLNGTKIGEDTSAPFSHRFVAPTTAGTYILSARATDNTGVARDTQVTITVGAAIGSPPTVSLLAPINGAAVVPNTAVSVAAIASAPGGNITSVQFYVNGSTALLSNNGLPTGSAYTVTFTPTAPGNYVLYAIATDDRGNSTASNAATVIATFAAPTVTITSPSAATVARATPNVPLTVTASATGGSGAAVLLVEFLIDGVTVGSRAAPTAGTSYSFPWTPTVAELGPHVLTARVTDTNSQSTTSAPVNLNVANIVGTPPTVTITSPTGAAALAIQNLSVVNFVANAFASGTGNTLSTVEFFLNDASIGSGAREQSTNLYRLTYNFAAYDFSLATPDANGRFPLTLYAIARDSNGNQTISPAITLGVVLSTSAGPSVQTLTQGQPAVTQGTPFLFAALSSDPDGAVASLQLFVNGAASGAAIVNPAPQTVVTYTPAAVGRFNLYVVATDDTGNTAVSSPSIVLNVTAVATPVTTLVRPTNDLTVATVSTPVFLEATASSPDNVPPNVTFVMIAASGARSVVNASRVGTTTTYRAVWTPTTASTYTVSSSAAVPTNPNVTGVSANTRRVTVTSVVGLAPTVTLSTPGTATTASTINLTATALDPDGAVNGVEFILNRNSIGQGVRDQLTNTWRITAPLANVTPGATEVVALARDDSGNLAVSATNSINVISATSVAPTITIAASTNNVAFSRQVQLTANARDPDGTISSVQYFANGTSLGTTGNLGTNYLVNWTPNQSGIFNVWALATDNTGNTRVSPAMEITVRSNNPIQDDDAFILQAYADIANASVPNALVFANLSAQLAAGTLTRAQLVANLTAENGFIAPVNLLAAYYAIMGQWPTPANYLNLLPTARTNLATAIGATLNSQEYVAAFGPTPTAAIFNANYATFSTFATRLWQNAGLGGPSTLQVFQLQNNNVALPTLGRGYIPAGLNGAIAEFITNTNSTNTAFLKRARAAALYYQLERPTAAVTVDEITARINALAQLADVPAMAAAVLQDQLYLYRYVTIVNHPQSLTVAPGTAAVFSVNAVGQPPLTYQWFFNGAAINGATGRTLTVPNVNAGRTGAYVVIVSSPVASATSNSAILGLTGGGGRVTGDSIEVARNVLASNNQTYDQVLLRGDFTTVTAEPGHVMRVSFIDLNDDIVQVEFSGAGALSILLENASGPAAPLKYHQPGVEYMKGHAGIVITGADETTNVSIFSVGRITAGNQSLFLPDVVYDGMADVAYLAILSETGGFGGARAANASFFATRGNAGIFAPNVQFAGPVFVGDIYAADDANAVLMLGSAGDVRITGGDLLQGNGRAVQVSGIESLRFVDGTTSHGTVQPAQTNRARLEQNGVDVTLLISGSP